jgi:hypothetical protein
VVGKKISVTVKEANVKKQTSFVAPIQQLDHNKVFYLDEAGFNPADQHHTSWGPTQNRLKGFKTGQRYTKDRVSVVSAYQHSKRYGANGLQRHNGISLLQYYYNKSSFASLTVTDIFLPTTS